MTMAIALPCIDNWFITGSLATNWKKTGMFWVAVALKLVMSQSPFWNARVLSMNASPIANVSETSCLS